jgi:hypothetical protein
VDQESNSSGARSRILDSDIGPVTSVLTRVIRYLP